MTRPSRGAVLGWCLLGVLAASIYQPARALPFDVWDFREFLPILQSRPGMLDGYRGLLEYYLSHGRMNPLFYLTFSVQYALFGEGAHAWQLLRFGMMLVNVALVMVLARRLGIGGLGAMLAGGLMVVGTPAVRGWVQLMAEPMALGTLLVATLLAVGFATATDWPRRTAAICLCLGATFLGKEVVGTIGALVVGLAVVGWDRAGELPPWRTPRNRWLTAAALGVVVLVGGMLLWVRTGDRATGYGMAYGSGALTLSHLWSNLVASLLPVRSEGRAALSLLYPANVAALLVAALGFMAALRRGVSRRRLGLALGLGFGVPVLGALAYLPWPKFDAFYALPLFVGPALLLGAAADELYRRGGGRRVVGVLGAVVVVGYAAIPAARSTETAAAAAYLNEGLARTLVSLTVEDTLFVLGPPTGPRRLPVRADELRDYAIARRFTTAVAAPTVVDVPCAYLGGVGDLARPHAAFLSYSYGCGRIPGSIVALNAPFVWRDWLDWSPVSDTLWADLAGAVLHRPR